MAIEKVILPVTNEYGFYEIRMESIGGLGANLSGKILGEVGALELGLNSSSFASYGSEKKGTPVKAFVRWCNADQDIGINSPIEKPHLLGIFHERLAGKVSVTAGVDENSITVVNTDADPDTIRERLELYAGEVVCIDALKIAMEAKTRINMVMLGAMAKASGFIPLESIENVVKETVGKKYPQALAGNLEGLKRGYDEVCMKKFTADGKFPYKEYQDVKRDWGYDNSPIGAVNPIIGSTISNDVTASRQGYVPVFKKESCINCGLCDTTCPDMVFQFAPGEFKGKPAMINLGPDYHHCKGCLRCVEVCPTDALTAGIERENDIWKKHVRNQDIKVEQMDFEDVGVNSIVESESSTTNDLQ